MEPLPDFDLAKLTKYRRDLLAPRDEDDDVIRQAKELTIILGLGFNVFKDLNWAVDRIRVAEKEAKSISPRYGQLHGMVATYTRLMTGTLHELGKAVKARSVVQTWGPWRRCIWRMPPKARKAWTEVMAMATQKGGYKPLTNYMRNVRDEISHHFDGPRLMGGYMRFLSSPDEIGNDALYISAGENMEGTRFYFADAAAIYADKEHLETTKATWASVNAIGEDINVALRHLVEAMLKEFGKPKKSKKERKRKSKS